MTTLTFTDEQLNTLRRAVLYDFHSVLEGFTPQVHQLMEQRDMGEGAVAADTAGMARIVREYLDALDALGWPEAEQKTTR